MLLFKKQKRTLRRIGQNCIVYGSLLLFVTLLLDSLAPAEIFKLLLPYMFTLSAAFPIGLIPCVLDFFLEIISLGKSNRRIHKFDREQKRLEKIANQSALLCEERNSFVTQDNFEHFDYHWFYLTNDNRVLKKSVTGMQDIHSLRARRSEILVYISFEELNRFIENSEQKKAKKYLGITTENCRSRIDDTTDNPGV